MTEQEIIYCLKENKIKGVAYFFLPEQVRDWVHDNLYEKCLMVLDSFGKFIFLDDVETGLINTDYYDNIVFTLPDNYKPKQEPKGEWVEFEIDEEGDFCDTYSWWDWNGFLTKAKSYEGVKYTAFGGWQYESNGFWLTGPHVKNEEGLLTTLTNCDEDCRPAIPSKIRFWRESK